MRLSRPTASTRTSIGGKVDGAGCDMITDTCHNRYALAGEQ